MKEGIATYAEWLWLTRGKDLSVLNKVVKLQAKWLAVPIGKPAAGDLYCREAYVGGAEVYHALRLRVGDEAFFRILRTYQERYRYSNADVNDLIAVAQEISGQDLQAFFDDWLLDTVVPDLPSPSN
jgi:aminopeptidase N